MEGPVVSQQGCLPSKRRHFGAVYNVWQLDDITLDLICWGFFFFTLLIEELCLWLVISLEGWKSSEQVLVSRRFIQRDHKPKTTFEDFRDPADTQEWRLACLARTVDLINKILVNGNLPLKNNK